jgi:hypothetical protein
MKSFLHSVQKSKTSQPTHLKRFNKQDWEASFQRSGDSSLTASRLYHSGLWINARLLELDRRARLLPLGSLDQIELTRLHLGYANRETTAVIREALAVGVPKNSDIFVAEHLAASKIQSSTGAQGSPDDFLEGVIDGLKIGLDSSRLGFTAKSEDDAQIVNAVRLHVNIGLLYSTFIGAWNDCLWRDWYVDTSGPVDILRAANDSVERGFSLAKFRAQRLLLEVFYGTNSAWSELRNQFPERFATRRRHVKALAGSGKSRKISISSESKEAVVPFDELSRMISDELFFTGLMDVPLPLCPELTIGSLARAWAVLRELASAISERWTDLTVKSARQLGGFAPAFTTSELLSVLRDCLGTGPDVAQKILKMLTRREDADANDPWVRPLEMLSNNQYCLALAPLESGNMVRLMEHWTRAGGLALEERGFAFESFARSEVGRAVASSKIDLRRGSWPESLFLKDENGKVLEEFDLVVWLGNTILVVELKCILFPSGAMAEKHYFETLQGAAVQISRKASLAATRPELMRNALRSRIDFGSEPLKIVPLVVPSTPLAVGLVFEGVPVADLRMVCRYFDRGFVEHAAVLGPDGKKNSAGFKTRFYPSTADAEDCLPAYFQSPPQIRFEANSLEESLRPLPKLSVDEKPAAIVVYDVNSDKVVRAALDAFGVG